MECRKRVFVLFIFCHYMDSYLKFFLETFHFLYRKNCCKMIVITFTVCICCKLYIMADIVNYMLDECIVISLGVVIDCVLYDV